MVGHHTAIHPFDLQLPGPFGIGRGANLTALPYGIPIWQWLAL